MEASDPTLTPATPEQGQVQDPGPSPSPVAADGGSASVDPSAPAPPAPDELNAGEEAPPPVVPEQRPQVFVGPDPLAQPPSKSAQAMDSAPAATQEDYDRANSDEAKEAAAKEARAPNLLPGQRVQLTGKDVTGVDQSGRMAYVLQPNYPDPIQAMIAGYGGPEARFAEVETYDVQTRDGRQDRLTVAPDALTPLEINEGWGRGPF